MTRAIVIGAGPSGLACAACLQRVGVDVEILERAACVGSSWHGHYERLHLHTVRGRSGLPFLPMPKTYGKFPSRAQMIGYLDAYARHFGLEPVFGTEVSNVVRSGAGWQVSHSGGQAVADVVVFATGMNNAAKSAGLPGMEAFAGPVVHSSQYNTADAYAGKSVLVVGFGNSGGDIALDLAEHGARPTLSVRGPVNILPHSLFGVPITSLGGLRKVLPYRWADAITAPILRAKIGRPEDYGLRSAGKGPAAQVIEDGRVPLIDIGTLAAIKAGKIAVRPGVANVGARQVAFTDGSADAFDAIILATGYRVDLRNMLPDAAEALTAEGRPKVSGAPSPVKGLYFCSYKASADGQLRQSGLEAKAIAADVSG